MTRGGGPKDPQLSKSSNALKLVFKRDWNVFYFPFIDFMKFSNQKIWNFFWGGYPYFVSKIECPSTAYDPTFRAKSFSILKMWMFAKKIKLNLTEIWGFKLQKSKILIFFKIFNFSLYEQKTPKISKFSRFFQKISYSWPVITPVFYMGQHWF